VQYPCKPNQTAANQSWKLSRFGNGYRVTAQHSQKCLDIAATTGSNAVIQAKCVNLTSQVWFVNGTGANLRFVNAKSGWCMNVSGSLTAPSTPLVHSPCSGKANESWRLVTAGTVGQWSKEIPLPLVPVAAANLYTGKVLLWASYDSFSTANLPEGTSTVLFDPLTNQSYYTLVENTQHDFFCPGTAMLPDGQLLVNGGTSSKKTSLYNPGTDTWTKGAQMNIPRGYNASTTLDNGNVFTIGGSWSVTGPSIAEKKNGEVWSPATGWTALPGLPVDPIIGADPGGVYRGDNHAWLFALEKGLVFHAGPSSQMNWFKTTGPNGSYLSAGKRATDPYSMNGNAVMFDIGKILKVGGAPAYRDADATRDAYTIDLSNGVSVVKTGLMNYPRAYQNSVILPDGRVFVAGGESHALNLSDALAILPAEIWNPKTGIFTTVASMSVPRNYHSFAILLPDARVLAGGGGLCEPCGENHSDVQIYSPDYLFKPNGFPASRPKIISVAPNLGYNKSVAVQTNVPVVSFALLRLSAVTHTTNNDQRRIPVTTQSVGPLRYTIKTPLNAGVATPGYYMLFAIDSLGVPSVAATVRLF
jgi:galactose oxidase